MSEISSIQEVTPRVSTYSYNQQSVYGSSLEGKSKVVETTFTVTLYDRNGYKQTTENTSTRSYYV
jgi:hypothetical protein